MRPLFVTATTPGSRRRILGLSKANALLVARNRMTLLYAAVFPLLPLLLLFEGDGETARHLPILSACLLTALLFPVYYNLLSMVVTRRDELVLKRMRTGEVRDGELLLGMALPGVAVALMTMGVMTGLGAALGVALPANIVLVGLGVLLAAATFAALALWTAAWTRNAEAAQLTSLPVFALILVGLFTELMPERLSAVAERTPGYALTDLLSVGWFADEGSLSFAETWTAGTEPLLVLAAWGLAAGWLAARTMRWEPRS